MFLILFSFAGIEAKSVKSSDGVPIVYDVQGKGEVTLVFVHCWCCNRGFWDAQVPHFAKKFQVVTLDLAGHGDSGKSRDKWAMKAYGEDVARVVNHLKLKKIILVGHSMGGPVIAEAACLLPGKVMGLIAVDTFTNIEHTFTKEQYDMFLAPLRRDFATGAKTFLEMMMFTPQTDPNVKERIVQTITGASAKVGIGSMEEMFVMDLPAVIKAANVHIRCINSDKYPNSTAAGKRHAKSFEVKFMKNVGHFLHMEKPAEFNRLMDEAINELMTLTK